MLRESIIHSQGRDIEDLGDKLRIGNKIIAKDAPTAFMKKLESTPYSLGALWGAYKYRDEQYRDYVKGVEGDNLDRVVVLDRPPVVKYLTGADTGEEHVDVSFVRTTAPIESVRQHALLMVFSAASIQRWAPGLCGIGVPRIRVQ